MITATRLTSRLVLAMAVIAALPGPARGQSKAVGQGFDPLGQFQVALQGNRVYCDHNTWAQVCTDAVGSSIGSGYWPSQTPNQHIFNSGPQVAAVIGPEGGPWAEDTTGAFFFDFKGTTEHATELVPMSGLAPFGTIQESFSRAPIPSTDPSDWPEAGLVPLDGPLGALFHPTLRGRPDPAEANLWWATWEGDVTRLAGRPHPLGVVVEVRVMTFRYPLGTDDQVYALLTVYNASATTPGAYASVRPAMRSILLDAAAQLHSTSREQLGVDLPAAGWTMRDLQFAWATDVDVADAGENYATVALPMGTSLGWDPSFDGAGAANLGWRFFPSIHGAPFFSGPGFVGVTSLGETQQPDVQLFTNTRNGGEFFDPWNTSALYRQLKGTLDPALGDPQCNHDPQADRVCYLYDERGDIRATQTWAAVDLAPGESRSYLAAFSFAAPVAVDGFTGAPTADIKPGSPTRWNDPAQLALGANQVDSIAGFAGWADDNGNGQVDGLEVRTVPGSFYWKAQVAQVLFGAGFLRAQPPAAPEFFLVPGDDRVTVLWRPSLTEEVGDPYWQVAGSPRTAEGFPNPLYDANYRQNDVEGYRIWRGRTDQPGALELVAQFDHDRSTFTDHYGVVDASVSCAPELGVTGGCAAAFEAPVPGEPLTVAAGYALDHAVAQVPAAGGHTPRALLPDGSTYLFEADTLRLPRPLEDTGVPFVFEDTDVRNGLRYFYAVTAFDVNSIRSGPSTLESVAAPRAVVPGAPASNHVASISVVTSEMLGRGRVLDLDAPFPTIDPTNGTFSGPMPPARGWAVELANLVPEVLASGAGTVTLRLDSLTPGSSYGAVPTTYWWRHLESGMVVPLAILQDPTSAPRDGYQDFDAVPLDPELAGAYGGSDGFSQKATVRQQLPGTYFAGGYGRGCVNSATGFARAGSRNCAYNGSRWFDGPSPQFNEFTPHPIAANTQNFAGIAQDPNRTNGGYLTGVDLVFQPQEYHSASTTYRQVTGMLSAIRRSADYNVYWGTGGTIDSVIDVTHNTVVPFAADHLNDTWGILNQSAAQPSGIGVSYDQRTELTPSDFGCIEPLRSDPAAAAHMPCGTGPGTGPQYQLSRAGIPGPIALVNGMSTPSQRTTPVQPSDGFGLYLAGNIHLFQMTGGALPAAGAVWTLRDYVGAIAGGGCATCGAGDYGDYSFTPYPVQPLTATGVELRLSYEVTNEVLAATNADLRGVHTVPDPYYLGSAAEPTGGAPELRFVNLPDLAIVRIYSLSGRLVRVLEHHGAVPTDAVTWDLTNRRGEQVAPGVYFWHVESGEARRIGRFTILDYRGGPL